MQYKYEFEIASSIGLANTKFVPQSVNELLAFAFFVLEGLVSYLLLWKTDVGKRVLTFLRRFAGNKEDYGR